jgi:hypothetical protein
MEKTTPNRTVVGGGVGSALGVIAVVMVPKVSEITWSAEEAALMTAALGALFAWLVRYLPRPGA